MNLHFEEPIWLWLALLAIPMVIFGWLFFGAMAPSRRFISIAARVLLVLILAGRRIFLGPEEGGLFTLFGILFFLISVTMVGIGLIGEYVGRTYQVVRARQRYHVREELGAPVAQSAAPVAPGPRSA